MGKIEDVRKAVTMDAKQPGDLVYVLGETREELGGSEWFALHGFIGNTVPKVNAQRAKKLYRALSRAIDSGLVASCHDCSDGGLGIALAEVAFAGGYGMDIALSDVPREGITRDDYLLFSESQSRFVVTISPDAKEAFEEIMAGHTCARIGTVTSEGIFRVAGMNGATILEESIASLKEAWQNPLDF
jgi:phosphoribosylformylglycinamidine synthase